MFKKKQNNNAYEQQGQKARSKVRNFKPGKIVGIFIELLRRRIFWSGAFIPLRKMNTQ